jgi:hypothetical protein
MTIKTSLGVYNITYYWDKAEVVKNKNGWAIELTYSGTPIATIKCLEVEVQEVLDKLNKKK